MIEVRRAYWRSLKDEAERIYTNNTLLTPYQSYFFLDTVGFGRQETHPLRRIGFTELTLLVMRDDKVMIIAPFYINKISKTIYLRGELSIAAHLDVIYSTEVTKDDYEALYDYLQRNYSGYTIGFDRITAHSLTHSFLYELGKVNGESSSVCVTIPFNEGYQSWYENLYKSFRQDIRSAYNRLTSDARKWNFQLDIKQAPSQDSQKEMLRLYSKRACEHSKIKSKFIEEILYLSKLNNPFNKALAQTQEYFGSRLYIDNKLVAYCQGFISNDKRAIIPKLSIDLDYKRYNLGGLLINETIKSVCLSPHHDYINQLDLSRGDERYKYDYGGQDHLNYEWTVKL